MWALLAMGDIIALLSPRTLDCGVWVHSYTLLGLGGVGKFDPCQEIHTAKEIASKSSIFRRTSSFQIVNYSAEPFAHATSDKQPTELPCGSIAQMAV